MNDKKPFFFSRRFFCSLEAGRIGQKKSHDNPGEIVTAVMLADEISPVTDRDSTLPLETHVTIAYHLADDLFRLDAPGTTLETARNALFF